MELTFKQFKTKKGVTEEQLKENPEKVAQLYDEYHVELQKKIKSELINEVNQTIESSTNKLLSEEQASNLINKAFDKLGDNESFKNLQQEILNLKENTSNSETEKESILEVIEKNMEGIKSSIDNKGSSHDFTLKADTTRASVVNSTQAMRLDSIGQLAYRAFVMRSVFPVVPVSAGSNGVIRYADWDEATKDRAAAMVAEGGQFPESTAAWAEYTLPLKKIGDSIPVTEEMLQDAPRFARELDQFLNVNVSIVEDQQLYDGDGTGNNLTGVYTTAQTFTATAQGITDANYYDLIVKVSEVITNGQRSKYLPNFVMMNITDINNMRLKKDADNNYIIPPFTTRDGQVIAGITVIESAAVTANTMLLGDGRFGTIYEVEGYNITTGMVNDQFTKDLMTLKAKKRLNLLVRVADRGAFVKVTNISDALATLATAP